MAQRERTVIEQPLAGRSGQFSRGDAVVGHVVGDGVVRLAGMECNFDRSGRMGRIELNAAAVHAPPGHGGNHRLTQGIPADPADDQGGETKGLQVPGRR